MSLKKLLLVPFALIIVAGAGCKKKHADLIAGIKTEKASINEHLKDYELIETQDAISKETGALTGYFDGKQPYKMSSQHFGEKRRLFRDFYFDEGMLIFVEEQLYLYNKPNTYTEDVAKAAGDSVWYDDSKTELVVNNYYFDDNKLVKWTTKNGRDIPTNGTEFKDAQTEILKQAILVLKQLKPDQ
jgi:hypothetical protein